VPGASKIDWSSQPVATVKIEASSGLQAAYELDFVSVDSGSHAYGYPFAILAISYGALEMRNVYPPFVVRYPMRLGIESVYSCLRSSGGSVMRG
jgi:hypothetical protein